MYPWPPHQQQPQCKMPLLSVISYSFIIFAGVNTTTEFWNSSTSVCLSMDNRDVFISYKITNITEAVDVINGFIFLFDFFVHQKNLSPLYFNLMFKLFTNTCHNLAKCRSSKHTISPPYLSFDNLCESVSMCVSVGRLLRGGGNWWEMGSLDPFPVENTPIVCIILIATMNVLPF